MHCLPIRDLPPFPDIAARTMEVFGGRRVTAPRFADEEDVVVGAAKREQSLGNVASAVTVVSGDRIRRFGYRTVGEAVAASPACTSSTTASRAARHPRPADPRRLQHAHPRAGRRRDRQRGVGRSSPASASTCRRRIDDIARIEVIRGPVSSVYGTNAFFGIINIVTRGAAETPRAWGRVDVNAIGSGRGDAGFAQRRPRPPAARHGAARLPVRRDAQRIRTSSRRGTATTPTARRPRRLARSALRRLVRAGRARYRASAVPVAPYDGRQPRDSTQPSTAAPRRGRPHARDVGKLTLAARAYANLYQFNDHIVATAGRRLRTTSGDAHGYGGELRGRSSDLPRRLGVTAGTEATDDVRRVSHSTTSTASAARDPIDRTSTSRACTPRSTARRTTWLGFTGGLRFDRNSVRRAALAARRAVPPRRRRYGVKLLYAEGFRNPSAFEAFFDDDTVQPVARRARRDATLSPSDHGIRGVAYGRRPPA